MIKSVLFLVLVSNTILASKVCKQNIVDFYKSIGVELKAETFSTTTFDKTNLTIEEFNDLKAEDQVKLYNKLMPLKMKANKTIDYISSIEKNIYTTIMAVEIYGKYGPYTSVDLVYLYATLKNFQAHKTSVQICTITNFSEAFRASLSKLELQRSSFSVKPIKSSI